jgi:hypothetical protein
MSAPGSSRRRTTAAFRRGYEEGMVAGAAAVDPALSRVPDLIAEVGGWWRHCSGCYDTEDGRPTADYPFSPILKCEVGSGCHECGGIGAVWDYYSEADLADLKAEGQ